MRPPSHIWPPAFLILAALLVFGSTLWGSPITDDVIIQKWLATAGDGAWLTPLPFMGGSYWRPLGALTMSIGDSHAVQRAINLAMACGFALTLWGIARKAAPVLTREAPIVATMLCAVFALHPAMSEAVGWVSARFDLGMALFSALALLCTLGGRFALAGVMAFCALLFKDSAPFALAGVVLVSMFAMDRKSAIKAVAAILSAGAAWLAWRSSIAGLGGSELARKAAEAMITPDGAENFLQALRGYVHLLAFPWTGVDNLHGRVEATSWTLISGLASCGLILGAILAPAFRPGRISAALAAASIPVLAVALLGASQNSGQWILQDRYLASTLPFLALATLWFLESRIGILALRPRGCRAMAAIALAVATCTAWNTTAWVDQKTLEARSWQRNPDNPAAAYLHLVALYNDGKWEQADAPSRAVLEYMRPQNMSEDRSRRAVFLRVAVLAEQGRHDEALSVREEWTRVGLGYPLLDARAAVSAFKLGRCEQATQWFDAQYFLSESQGDKLFSELAALSKSCKAESPSVLSARLAYKAYLSGKHGEAAKLAKESILALDGDGRKDLIPVVRGLLALSAARSGDGDTALALVTEDKAKNVRFDKRMHAAEAWSLIPRGQGHCPDARDAFTRYMLSGKVQDDEETTYSLMSRLKNSECSPTLK